MPIKRWGGGFGERRSVKSSSIEWLWRRIGIVGDRRSRRRSGLIRLYSLKYNPDCSTGHPESVTQEIQHCARQLW